MSRSSGWSARKIITDTVKMVAYRAETQLANLVGPLLPSRHDEARKFMRPNLLPVCGVLNELDVSYPDTELRLVLEATPAATESR